MTNLNHITVSQNAGYRWEECLIDFIEGKLILLTLPISPDFQMLCFSEQVVFVVFRESRVIDYAENTNDSLPFILNHFHQIYGDADPYPQYYDD